MSLNQFEELWKAAILAQSNSYSPYSKFAVGCAIRIKAASGESAVVQGCNVENASFGATICAERSAIFSMVAKYGPAKVEAVLIVTDLPDPAPPCGMCLQVISEFANAQTKVVLANKTKIFAAQPFSEYLPNQFKFSGK